MPRHLDDQLLDLLAERVGFILARLPAHVDPELALGHPESQAGLQRDPELTRALGWIEGLADAVDVTVLELLDEAEIVVDSLHPALPRPH